MFQQISSQERVNFAKNLAVMLKSGIPINEAMEVLAGQIKSGALRKIVSNVQKDLERGTSLSLAFGQEEKVFGKMFISVLYAGEKSGTLEENLFFLASLLEQGNDLKKEINGAMLYPKIIIGATVMLGGGLAIFLLPRLVPLFKQLRVELPLTTKILFSFSLFLQHFWLLLVLGFLGFVVAFLFLKRLKTVRRFLDFVSLKLPLAGNLFLEYQVAFICQMLFTLFRSGISVMESLDIASESAGNIFYQESLRDMKDRIGKGISLSQVMGAYPALYPKNLVNIIAVGERSGTLDTSLNYGAEFYAKEVRNKTKQLPLLVEPLLLVLIGLVIGFVALSIIMPIYQLTQGLGK